MVNFQFIYIRAKDKPRETDIVTPLYSVILRYTPLYSVILRYTPLYSVILRYTPLPLHTRDVYVSTPLGINLILF